MKKAPRTDEGERRERERDKRSKPVCADEFRKERNALAAKHRSYKMRIISERSGSFS